MDDEIADHGRRQRSGFTNRRLWQYDVGHTKHRSQPAICVRSQQRRQHHHDRLESGSRSDHNAGNLYRHPAILADQWAIGGGAIFAINLIPDVERRHHGGRAQYAGRGFAHRSNLHIIGDKMVFRIVAILVLLLLLLGCRGANAQACPPGITCWSTANRPTSPILGQTGLNTSLSINEIWNGARWVAQFLDSAANPLDFTSGVAAGSVTDWTTAINAAAATNKDVRLPAGTYHINGAITLANGQCLWGAGDHSTFLTIDQNFSSSATGVITLTGTETNSPCVHDIAMIFSQPPDVVTTANGAASAGQNQVTVTSATNIRTNYYITDWGTGGATLSNAFPTNIITPNSGVKVSSIAGNVLTLSANVAAPGVVNTDSLRFGPSRTNFATLGTCTSGAGGTGCKYPPAIYTTTANRPRFWNIHIEGAWDGFSFIGNIAPTLQNIEMGSLDKGLDLDGGQDFAHVRGWHAWSFFPVLTNTYNTLIYNTYADGSNIGWNIGRMDGLNAVDVNFFDVSLTITSNANSSATPIHLTNVMLDGQLATLKIAGGLHNQFTNMYSSGGAPDTNCKFGITGGSTQISNFWNVITTAVAGATNQVCVSGGFLRVDGGYMLMSGTTTTGFLQTGGVMILQNLYWDMPATLTVPAISQTAAAGVAATLVTGNLAHSGTSGTAVSITNDTSWNVVAGNSFNNYGYSLPNPTLGGSYNTGGPLVNVYTSTGANTWYRPNPSKFVMVELCGAGGSGGGGAHQVSAQAASGGGGGGGGDCHTWNFRASDLTSTVTVTVGAGTSGGAASASNTTAGTAGTAGGASQFGSFLAPGGGGGGAGGQIAATSGGGGGGALGQNGGSASTGTGGTAGYSAGTGGSGVSAAAIALGGPTGAVGAGGGGSSATGAPGDGGSNLYGCGGGGSGGGIATAANNNGGAGGLSIQGTGLVAPTGGTSGSKNGQPGSTTAAATTYSPGHGGGGGYGNFNTGGPAGNGGAGNQCGGGGGGGSTINGQTAGTGGAGGNGFAIVTAW